MRLGKKWGYIDPTGQMVVPLKFTAAWEFTEGLAAFKLGGNYGFIDRTGKIVIAPRWDRVAHFHEGRAAVEIGRQSGYIDRTGKFGWRSPGAAPAAGLKVEDS